MKNILFLAGCFLIGAAIGFIILMVTVKSAKKKISEGISHKINEESREERKKNEENGHL